MNKILIIPLLSFLIFACSERSKITNPDDNPGLYTEIQGYISGNLPLENSPYLVVDELIVDAARNLILDPGVSLHFTDTSSFKIFGTIIAIGTIDTFITFTAYDNYWKGIRIENSNQISFFQYALIEKVSLSSEDSTELGALQINNSRISIRQCIFKENRERSRRFCFHRRGRNIQ